MYLYHYNVMRITKKVRQRIDWILGLLQEYERMTLRQIFYRLLEKDSTLNYRQVEYALNQARDHGFIPYGRIVDRSRTEYGVQAYPGVDPYLSRIPDSFYLDYWVDSEVRPEIWTEKDALSQVIYEVASLYHVDVKVTRGWCSKTKKAEWGGSNIAILYFGDHDPSGIYMDENIAEDPNVEYAEMRRVALTMEQVERYGLLENPLKLKEKDSRTPRYREEYGDHCWELDALPPDVLQWYVLKAIQGYANFEVEQKRREEEAIRDALREYLEL